MWQVCLNIPPDMLEPHIVPGHVRNYTGCVWHSFCATGPHVCQCSSLFNTPLKHADHWHWTVCLSSESMNCDCVFTVQFHCNQFWCSCVCTHFAVWANWQVVQLIAYIHFIFVRNFNSVTSFPGGVTCQAQSTHAELVIGLVHGPHPSSLLASDRVRVCGECCRSKLTLSSHHSEVQCPLKLNPLIQKSNEGFV